MNSQILPTLQDCLMARKISIEYPEWFTQNTNMKNGDPHKSTHTVIYLRKEAGWKSSFVTVIDLALRYQFPTQVLTLTEEDQKLLNFAKSPRLNKFQKLLIQWKLVSYESPSCIFDDGTLT